MARALLLILLMAATVAAQNPPASYPIEGRFGCLGYDKNLTYPGDLGSITPGTGGADNGVLFILPSRNVSLNFDTGRWDVELGHWNGSAYQWTHQSLSIAHCLYYPDVVWGTADPHAWASGLFTTPVSYDAGALAAWGYDGAGSIAGDLFPGVDNGLVLTLPIAAPHLMVGAGGSVWHGGLWVQDLDGVRRFKWAVYPSIASLQIMTAQWLAQVTGP